MYSKELLSAPPTCFEEWRGGVGGGHMFFGIPRSQRSLPSRPQEISGVTLAKLLLLDLDFSYSCGQYIQGASMA